MLQMLNAALQAVEPQRLVFDALRNEQHKEIALVAIGKAASGMIRGARAALNGQVAESLVITAAAYADGLPADVAWVEGSHPLPDEKSLAAGEALLAFIKRQSASCKFLFLVSGGASAMVEVLAPGVTLDQLQRVNRWLLGSGLSIRQVNCVRKAMSQIKGGGLLSRTGEREVLCLLVSDVPGDDPGSIGSGLLVAAGSGPGERLADLSLPGWILDSLPAGGRSAVSREAEIWIIASNSTALGGAAREAQRLGFETHQHRQLLQGDAIGAAQQIAGYLREAPPGIHLWGGETTVRLPPQPGRGGRNQQLALAAAIELRGCEDVLLLSAGSDGIDGNSSDAGALIDGGTMQRGEAQGLDALAHLHSANANRFLAESGDLVHTGPTGTNVMDIVIACKIANNI
ncbi:MAG: DUF4147 domain-containing protein [Pseudomonadota bacterium]